MLPFIGGYLAGQRARTRAAGMSASAAGFASDMRSMGEEEERWERLVLVVEAMWEVLKEHGHSDADLDARITEVIERREAGRASLSGQLCPECSARISGGQTRCQICGHEVETEPDPLAGL